MKRFPKLSDLQTPAPKQAKRQDWRDLLKTAEAYVASFS